MKRVLLAATCLVALNSFAQKDTTATTTKVDTIQVGGFVIVKKKNPSAVTITSDGEVTVKRKRNLSTNWFILDLGFANMRDNTNYTAFASSSYNNQTGNPSLDVNKNGFRLKQGKTSNVNLWIFMQKLNIAKKVVNLKYGLGLEMYNFRYSNNISYRKGSGTTSPYVHMDSINFSKNKLYASYVTVPLMININPTPNKSNRFSFSAGVSAGYLLASRNKQVSSERGKVKYKGDLDLQPWRLAGIAEVGIGPVRLYGTYSFNALHRESTGLDQAPYAVGIRFSSW